MDPRDRADETLARARARGAFVVTPDSATSPMDASTTVRIPRTVVDAADHAQVDADATTAIPQATAPQQSQQGGQQQAAWPQQRAEQRPQQTGQGHYQQSGQQGQQQNRPQQQGGDQQARQQGGQQAGPPQGAQQQVGQQHGGQQQAGQQQGGQQQGTQQQGGQQQAGQQQGGRNDQYGWPDEDFGQQLPPNPYQAQRPEGQFGPLGSRAARQQY